MKNILFIILLSILLSCTNQSKEVVTAKYSNGKPAIVSVVKMNGDTTDTIKHIEYYPNGKKKTEGGIKNNLRDNKWTFWYENGNIWSEGNFVNGKSEGVFNIYNEDGSKYMQSNYKDGIPDGCWTFYLNNKKKKEAFFDKGKKIKEINY